MSLTKSMNVVERMPILQHGHGIVKRLKTPKKNYRKCSFLSNEMTFPTLIWTEGLPIEFLCMERTSSIWMIFKRSTEKTCHVTDVSQVKKDYPKNRRGTLVHFLDISL